MRKVLRVDSFGSGWNERAGKGLSVRDLGSDLSVSLSAITSLPERFEEILAHPNSVAGLEDAGKRA